MADRSAHKNYNFRAGPTHYQKTWIIADGVTVYNGQLVQVEGGYANHWDDSAAGTDRFAGLATNADSYNNDGTWLGEITPTLNRAVPRVVVDEGTIITGFDSMEGTSAITDIGALVYCPDSDLDSATLQSSGNTNVIGVVEDWRSTTDLDIRLFTMMEWLAYNFESPGS